MNLFDWKEKITDDWTEKTRSLSPTAKLGVAQLPAFKWNANAVLHPAKSDNFYLVVSIFIRICVFAIRWLEILETITTFFINFSLTL